MSHFENLTRYLPQLSQTRILDLGSGKGGFLLEVARHGGRAVGLELSEDYIALAHERLKKAGYTADIVQGAAEHLPFADNSFDFINIGEVIEHIQDTEKMLREAYRVLAPGGHIYLSAPNRYGIRDQHFHLYFVNWLPRALADSYIGLWGKHKDYKDLSAGHQRLADMHYYTYSGIKLLAENVGFHVENLHTLRIERMGLPARIFLRIMYPLARMFYFDSFHLLLTKSS